MTTILRYSLLPILLIISGAFGGLVSQARAEDVRQRIALSYGIDRFDQVEPVRSAQYWRIDQASNRPRQKN